MLRDRLYDLTGDPDVSLLYRRPLNEIAGPESHLGANVSYLQASRFADHLVTLPTHKQVGHKLIDKIITELKRALTPDL